MPKSIKEMTEARAAKLEEARNLVSVAEKENRDLKSEELDKLESLNSEAEILARSVQEQYRLLNQEGRRLDAYSQKERRDIETFSLSRFVLQAARGHFDGIEAEMVQEGEKVARDRGVSSRGLMLPPEAITVNRERRDMTATGGTDLNEGGLTIATDKMPLIEALFHRQVLNQAGITVLNDVTGNFDVPRIVKDATGAVKKAENAASAEQSPTISQVSFSPNRLPTYVEVSNQLIKQSNDRALTAILQRHLQRDIMEKIQIAFLHGTGTTEAEGVAATTGIGAVVGGTNGATPDYADIVKLQTEVAVDDADMEPLSFVTNPKVEGKLKQVQKVSSTDSYTLIDARTGRTLDSKPYYITNSVSSALTKGSASGICSAIFYGNWAEYWAAYWGGIEFLVNQFSLDKEGMVRINAAVYYDGHCVVPQAFSAMLDALTA